MPSVKGNACLYCLNCTKFGQSIIRKINKIIATRCQILRPKCTKFDFGWGSVPDPVGGAYVAPQGAASRQGGEGIGKGKEREGVKNLRKEDGKVTGGMGATARTGHGIGRGGKGRMKWRERERRSYSPQTAIPGAATDHHHQLHTFKHLKSNDQTHRF